MRVVVIKNTTSYFFTISFFSCSYYATFSHKAFFFPSHEKFKNRNKLNAQFFLIFHAPQTPLKPEAAFFNSAEKRQKRYEKNHEKITKTNVFFCSFFLKGSQVAPQCARQRVVSLLSFHFPLLVYIFNTFCIQILRLANFVYYSFLLYLLFHKDYKY